MILMDWVNRLHPAIRWILFIPTLVVTYFIFFFISNVTLLYTFGPKDEGVVNTIIYAMQIDFISAGLAFYLSCEMIPRGKIVLSSIYVILNLLLVGANTTIWLAGLSAINLATVLGTIATPAAAITVLIAYVIEWRKNEAKKIKELLVEDQEYEYRGFY